MGSGVSKTKPQEIASNGGQLLLHPHETNGTSPTPEMSKKRRLSWFKSPSLAAATPAADNLQVPAENIIKFLKDMRMKILAQGTFTEDEIRSFDTVVNRLTVDKVYEVELSDGISKEVDLEVMKWLKRKFSVQTSENTPTKRPSARTSFDGTDITTPTDGNGNLTPFTATPSSNFERWRKHSVIRSQKTREDIVAMFDRVDNWNFDVFTLNELTNGHTLLITGLTLFIKYDLLNKFGIPENVLLAFLSKIEAGYHNNPYHNSMHAADVLQVLHYFIVKGGLIRFLSDEDILSCLVAAICHDFDHPGLNNAFQVATKSPLALLYNDKAVLENHHCSSSFSVIKIPKYDIFASLSPDQMKEVRATIISMILATDMGQHAKIVAKFKGRLEGGVDLTERSDVSLALQIAIKCADVSNPARPRELYLKWAHRVCEEFYRQGDKERDLRLPISPFMDRTAPALAKGQLAFTNYIVQPLFAQFSLLLPSLQFAQDHINDTKDYWSSLLKQD